MELTLGSIFSNQEELCDEVAANPKSWKQFAKFVWVSIWGLAFYGLIMGISHSPAQAISTAVKLPVLFYLSGLITLPALHFIGLHLGSRMSPQQTLRVCANGMAVTGVLAAAISPIMLFFLFTGSSYSFLILTHVAVLGFCAACGGAAMNRNLKQLREKTGERLAPGGEWCFPAWIVMFAFVGTQLAYMMRPFVGSGTEFVLINTGKGNFFEAVAGSLIKLFQ